MKMTGGPVYHSWFNICGMVPPLVKNLKSMISLKVIAAPFQVLS